MLSTIILLVALVGIVAVLLTPLTERKAAKKLAKAQAKNTELVRVLAENAKTINSLVATHELLLSEVDDLRAEYAALVLGAELITEYPRLVIDNTKPEIPAWLESVFEMDQA